MGSEVYPLFNPLSPTTRQTTRALQEIQSQRPNLLVVQQGGDGQELIQFTPLPMQPIDITDRMRWSTNLISSPNPSPDEMVIQARGRRTIPLTYSPDIRQVTRQSQSGLTQSPTRPHTSRLLLSPTSRSSPRKRLTLSDTPPSGPVSSSFYSPSPDKTRRSPISKKLRLSPQSSVTTETLMKGLSHGQLVQLVTDLMSARPDIKKEVRELLPNPDLTEHEANLNYLKRNIYKALPSTRLESKTDSMAYNRVSVHLMAFKKCLTDGMKCLLDSHQWVSVIDYTVMGWGYVKSTPVWSNPPHNTVRKACFKALAMGAMRALREGGFGQDEHLAIRDKLDKLRGESDEVIVCIKYIDFILRNSDGEIEN